MTKRILICDDEVHIVRATEIKLTRAGLNVETACDGQEAWEAIERCKPDLVITDCQMPRLDGIGLVERIRSRPELNDLPVLMLTAKGYEMVKGDLTRRFGVLAVLSKPFSPRQLLACVTEILETGSLTSETAAV